MNQSRGQISGRYAGVGTFSVMVQHRSQTEPTIVRRVFPRWSVTIPLAFEETFVSDAQYWHAWDDRRSVSLTSVVITDRRGRPVSAAQIIKRIPVEQGERVAVPAGLEGRAVAITLQPPARASHAISGIITVDGGALLATVTAEELSWATSVWLSIRRCRTPGDA